MSLGSQQTHVCACRWTIKCLCCYDSVAYCRDKNDNHLSRDGTCDSVDDKIPSSQMAAKYKVGRCVAADGTRVWRRFSRCDESCQDHVSAGDQPPRFPARACRTASRAPLHLMGNLYINVFTSTCVGTITTCANAHYGPASHNSDTSIARPRTCADTYT